MITRKKLIPRKILTFQVPIQRVMVALFVLVISVFRSFLLLVLLTKMTRRLELPLSVIVIPRVVLVSILR